MSFYAGQRVRHNCGDPRCDLKGTIVDVASFRSRTLGDHREYSEWALVDMDLPSPHTGVLRQWLPLERLAPLQT